MTVENKTTSAQLSFAIDLCKHAGEIILKHFHKGVEADTKHDGSPVTVADRECERLIRESLLSKFPQDGILGEEDGETVCKNEGCKRKWIIDPIDGTYNFARGIPIFSTLLALEEDGEIVLGVVHAPAMGETFWAEKNSGAYKNGNKIKVSNCQELHKAHFTFGSPARILDKRLWNGLAKVISSTAWQRCYGDYKNFACVFEGQAEAVLEVGLKPWDLAPMKIIAQEAGGQYSDLSGGSSIYEGGCLISNGILHKEIMQLLG